MLVAGHSETTPAAKRPEDNLRGQQGIRGTRFGAEGPKARVDLETSGSIRAQAYSIVRNI